MHGYSMDTQVPQDTRGWSHWRFSRAGQLRSRKNAHEEPHQSCKAFSAVLKQLSTISARNHESMQATERTARKWDKKKKKSRTQCEQQTLKFSWSLMALQMLWPVNAAFPKPLLCTLAALQWKPPDTSQFWEMPSELGRQMNTWTWIKGPQCTKVSRCSGALLKRSSHVAWKMMEFSSGRGKWEQGGGGCSLFCREKTESLNRLQQEMEASLDNNKTYSWWKKTPKQAESAEGGSDTQPPPSDREWEST